MQQLHNVIQYINTYRKTRVIQFNFMGNLVVFMNANTVARHFIHRVHTWSNVAGPNFKETVYRWYRAEHLQWVVGDAVFAVSLGEVAQVRPDDHLHPDLLVR